MNMIQSLRSRSLAFLNDKILRMSWSSGWKVSLQPCHVLFLQLCLASSVGAPHRPLYWNWRDLDSNLASIASLVYDFELLVFHLDFLLFCIEWTWTEKCLGFLKNVVSVLSIPSHLPNTHTHTHTHTHTLSLSLSPRKVQTLKLDLLP